MYEFITSVPVGLPASPLRIAVTVAHILRKEGYILHDLRHQGVIHDAIARDYLHVLSGIGTPSQDETKLLVFVDESTPGVKTETLYIYGYLLTRCPNECNPLGGYHKIWDFCPICGGKLRKYL